MRAATVWCFRLGVAHADHAKDHGLAAEHVESLEVEVGLGGSRQLLQEGFRLLQVRGGKTFGEAVVNRLENSHRIRGTPLTVQKAGKAEGDPQLPKQGALLAGHLARLVKAVFGCGSGLISGLPQQHLALDAEQLGDTPLLAVFSSPGRFDRLAHGIVRLVARGGRSRHPRRAP